MNRRVPTIILTLAASAVAQSRPATLPATQPADGPGGALTAFIAAAAKRDRVAVEAAMFELESNDSPPDAMKLIASIDGGLFEGAAVAIKGTRVNVDCGVLVAELTLGSGRKTTDVMFAIQHDGQWKLLMQPPDSSVVLRAKNLTGPQKARLGALNLWAQGQMRQARLGEDVRPTTQEAARLARQSDLALAVMHGEADKVGALVAAGADVNESSRAGDPPLCYAAWQAKPDMVRLLLALGAKADPPWSNKVPLFEAIDHGRSVNARQLIEAGARIDRLGADAVTPLFGATAKGLADTVKLLLEKGAKSDDARTPFPLLHAAALSGDAATFALVKPLYPSLLIAGRGGSTALHFLAQSESRKVDDLRKIARELLAAGVDPHAVWTSAWLRFERGTDTALRIAMSAGQNTVADVLLDDVAYPSAELTRCVRWASSVSVRTDVLRKLVAKGASVPESAGAGGATPLHRAVRYYVGDIEKLSLLLDAGHPIDPRTGEKGRTPLLTAITCSRAEFVRLLLARGADATIKDADGHDATALARIRIEKGREIGFGSDGPRYRIDEGEAALDGQRILDLLTKK